MEGNSKKDIGAIASSLAMTTAQGISEMPFVTGVNTFMNGVTDPERYGEQAIKVFAGGFMPSGLRDVRKAVDPYVRETTGLGSYLQNIIPGLSQKLEPRINVLGEKAQYQGANAFMRGFVKVIGTEKQSAIEQVLTDAGYTPGVVRDTLKKGDKEIKLEGEQRTQYLEEMGAATATAIQQVSNNPTFNGLTKEIKEVVLKRAVDKARDAVRSKWKNTILLNLST